MGDLKSKKVAYTTNRGRDGVGKQPQELFPGLYGLSNGVLGDKWVKVICRPTKATLILFPEMFATIVHQRRRVVFHCPVEQYLANKALTTSITFDIHVGILCHGNFNTQYCTALSAFQKAAIRHRPESCTRLRLAWTGGAGPGQAAEPGRGRWVCRGAHPMGGHHD